MGKSTKTERTGQLYKNTITSDRMDASAIKPLSAHKNKNKYVTTYRRINKYKIHLLVTDRHKRQADMGGTKDRWV